jgi:hypothetical protein
MGGVNDDTPTGVAPAQGLALMDQMIEAVDYAVAYDSPDAMPPVDEPEDEE